MAKLDFKKTSCFGSGRKFGHFFAETEISETLIFAEAETEYLLGHYTLIYRAIEKNSIIFLLHEITRRNF